MNISKWAFVALFSLYLTACVSERKTLDSWLEKDIKNLILQAGPPAQVTSDGSDGKIYVYSVSSTNGISGVTYYTYVFWYTTKDGIIYHWLERKGTVPPQRVNVDLYIH